MLFISDLDHTLIYSHRIIDKLNGMIPSDLHCLEVYKNKEYSYQTKKAQAYCKTLIENRCLIPATTRTIEQYNRIEFSPKKLPWVITYNGAVILDDGFVDKDWNNEVLSHLKDSLDFVDMEIKLLSYSKEPWLIKMKRAGSWFFYFIVDEIKIDDTKIKELDRLATINNWVFSIIGKKFFFIPKFISKKNAASYILDKTNKTNYIAAGDSLLDLPLIEKAVEGYVPPHGELFKFYEKDNTHNENIYIMESQGVFCGEEILRRAIKKIGIPLKRTHKKYVKR